MVTSESVSSIAGSAADLAEQSTPADTKAVDAFEQALTGEGNSPGQDSLGQDMVEQLGELRESYNTKVEAITNSASDVASPAEMLRLQWQISSLTLQQDLLAKTAGKSNQNLETLLKMQ